ncbi:hypothetical protein B4U80_12872 [Leptotrombidium deliense]|uniref:Sushi domain-containing protein n=1 Tax=Leptotrombidium deliense TaxID=299467 RepID=A0A443SIT8_9ACAR|nr:hypothetical protein B4U80_12872 [Leptotrombidium deliense]
MIVFKMLLFLLLSFVELKETVEKKNKQRSDKIPFFADDYDYVTHSTKQNKDQIPEYPVYDYSDNGGVQVDEFAQNNPEESSARDAPSDTTRAFLSIDYSNRICPEYFGNRASDCDQCTPPACVVESDILCPYDQYDGPCDTNYIDCGNRKMPGSFTALGKIKGELWPRNLYGGFWVIQYKFFYIGGKEHEWSTEWRYPIERAMEEIQKKTCIKFLDVNQVQKLQLRFDSKRHIKFVETMCLCGVNRIGSKPNDASADEIDETIVYWPTRQPKYQKSLREIYQTEAIKHFPYYTYGIDETNITCSSNPVAIYHLLMHALGFGHANNRKDRDDWIFVNKQNLEEPQGYDNTPIERFFKKDNLDLPSFESYSHITPQRSVTFMDPMAWSKYSSLATFSPIIDTMNPVSWQRSLSLDDIDMLVKVYGPPPTSKDPCWMYGGKARYSDDYEQYRNVKNCPDVIESTTTFRKMYFHFGANITFSCKNDHFVMFGDKQRTCQRNGQWSGEQPFCMPPEMVTFFCSYAANEKHCKRPKPMNDSSSIQKRSIDDTTNHARFKSTFKTKEMNALSNIVCIGFKYLFQANSSVEVYLKQNEIWNLVWNEMSAKVFTTNNVEFEVNVEKGKKFAVKVIGKYENGIAQEFYIMHMYVFGDHCNVK